MPKFAYTAATYDVPFGRVVRGLSEFVKPATSWMNVGTAASLALVGAGAKAFWAATSGIGINLLRTGPYISMSEKVASYTPDQLQDYGEARAVFAIHTGGYDPIALSHQAERLDRAFPAMWVGVHDGDEARRRGFLEIDATIALASLRRDLQAPGALIARTYDLTGRKHSAAFAIAGHRFIGDYDAYGIRTLRITDDKATLSLRD